MIFYFSGTGNSAYIAKRIGKILDEPINSINDFIKNGKTVSAVEGERLVFVTPTYAWRMPRIVEEWIRKCDFSGKHEVYSVMTCGSENGNASHYIKEFCAAKGFTYMGCAEIVMPENYIAMYSTPTQEEAKKIIADAEQLITETAERIRDCSKLPEHKIRFGDFVKSGIINPIFYKFFVHATKYQAKDTCINCGKCVANCPLNNIELKDNRPVWGNNCTHCMACICKCPVGAIEYGKHSVGQQRYQCPY